jgi:hypothetical protein
MTYLNLINNVLRRLREDEVSSVNSNTYSKMVGDFVNDAKTIVEQAADWSALRTRESAFVTTADDNIYSLSGSGNDIKVMSVYNTSSKKEMSYQTKEWFNNENYVKNSLLISSEGGLIGSPDYYTFDGVDSNGDTQVRLYPMPDDAYNIRFVMVRRQADLSLNNDTLLIPAKPVIHLAVAFLARERGETGGTSAAEYFSIADKYLSDAIAFDAAKHPEETVFYTI